MSKADLLLKAQNSKRTLPKRDALPPTKTVLSDESTIIETPQKPEEKPAVEPEKTTCNAIGPVIIYSRQ